MPLYHQVVTTTASASPALLTALFRKIAHHVVKKGGVVRSCENYGIKLLGQRFKSAHVSAGEPGRWHKVGRFVGMHYDGPPIIVDEIKTVLKQHESVLRYTMLKTDPKSDRVNSYKKTNPWKVTEKNHFNDEPPDGAWDDPVPVEEDDDDSDEEVVTARAEMLGLKQ
ncbi:hypothetical protein M885DRAFT_510407 [Pelagophyceae sp. CCMP2097]|nr:hypothetical protein M885DRAFT_510407 [Pelagophyceae sp. CCMP2097]